jgi:hypothetical protein
LLNWGDDETGEWKEASSGGELFRVIGRGTKLEEGQDCKKLMRIRIAVEADGVWSEYEITYSGHARINTAVGFAYVSAGAPGGRETGAERFSALVKALTGKELKMCRMKGGRIKIECYEGHLEGFARFAELADAIMKWLEETDRQWRRFRR